MTTKTTKLLFVYGTLMRGECREVALADARFVGERETRAEFALLDLGAFPAMVEGTRVVRGEVYEVEPRHIERCDRIEGHPHFYRRTAVVLADGTEVETYVLPAEQASTRWRAPSLIESGTWRDAPGSAAQRAEEGAGQWS